MGFEVVVRPVFFPTSGRRRHSRCRRRTIPKKGFAVIRGNGAKEVSLSNSYSASVSSGQQREIKRRVDIGARLSTGRRTRPSIRTILSISKWPIKCG